MKKIICALVTAIICMVFALAYAETDADNKCGDNMTWELLDDGVLLIQGEGNMYDFDTYSNPAPWHDLSIKRIEMKGRITSIGQYAFYGSALKEIVIPDTVSSLGAYAFDSSGLTRVVIPDSVSSIPSYCFDGCRDLEYVDWPSQLHTIGHSAFCGCSALKQVVFPATLSFIDEYAFLGCSSLQTVVFPKHFSELGNCSFRYCESLKSVYFLGNAPSWTISSSSNIFAGRNFNAQFYRPANDDSWTATCGRYVGYIEYMISGDLKQNSEDEDCMNWHQISTNININLYDGETGESVSAFSRAGNRISWNNKETASSLKLEIVGSDEKDIPASEFTVKLPDGWSFSKGSVVLNRKISTDSTKRCFVTIYPVRKYTSSRRFRFSVEGQLGGFADFSITDKTEFELYADRELKDLISSLDYCDGNLLTSNYSDDNIVYLKLDIGNAINKSVTVSLPSGMSFSNDSDDTRKRIDYDIAYYENDIEPIPIYLTYNDVNSGGEATIQVTGDYESSLTIPVYPAEKSISINDYTGALFYEWENIDWLSAFKAGATQSNQPKLANLGAYLSFAGYDENAIKQALHNLGFHSIRFFDSNDKMGIGLCLGLKNIRVKGDTEARTVLAVVVRGTAIFVGDRMRTAELIGDFIVGDGPSPASFSAAANTTLERISSYVNEYCSAQNLDKSAISAYICGHSRGAAVADILALRMYKCGYGGLTGYTYATPNSIDNQQASLYPDISVYNYCFADDIVAYVPQGYYKVGKTYMFGGLSKSAVPPAVEDAYFDYTGQRYWLPSQKTAIELAISMDKDANGWATKHPIQTLFGVGALSATTSNRWNALLIAHSPANYTAWVKTYHDTGTMGYKEACARYADGEIKKVKNQINSFKKKWDNTVQTVRDKIGAVKKKIVAFTDRIRLSIAANVAEMIGKFKKVDLIHIGCPVDLEVVDASNDVVASIVAHEAQFYDEGNVFVIAEDDLDVVIVPASMGYSIRIRATDSGTMDVGLCEISDSKDFDNYQSFIDVALTAGESFDLVLHIDSSDAAELWTGRGMVYKADGTVSTQATTFDMPSGIEVIEEEAFAGDQSITGHLRLQEGVKRIESKAFTGTGITIVDMPESLEYIAEDAFEGMLQTVVFCCYHESYAEEWVNQHGGIMSYRQQ